MDDERREIRSGALVIRDLIFCRVDRVDYSFIHSREVLTPEGLLRLDLPVVLEKHGAVARSLVVSAPPTPTGL